MAEITIVYWRDMPAQVVARAGRRAAKSELPKRFMEAIDAAAMRAGATDSDAYLADWRRGEPSTCDDDIDQAVKDAVAVLDSEYGADRLRQLIETGGRDNLKA